MATLFSYKPILIKSHYRHQLLPYEKKFNYCHGRHAAAMH